jgi:hypothetical protein
MKRTFLLLLASAAVVSSQAQFHGSPGFFGGYADGLTSVPTGRNTLGPQLRIAYDDFTFQLPGNIVGFEMIGRDNTGAPVAMYYEIRSGMSPGNGGTLLFSGTSPSAAAGDLPLDGSLGTPPPGTGNYRWYDAGPTTPIHLEPGNYWIGLAPLQQFGSFDVASTQGLLAVGEPTDNGNAFYFDSSDPGAVYVSQGSTDFGLRVVTEASVVPEPGTLSLLTIGGAGWLICRRRRTPCRPQAAGYDASGGPNG